MSWANIFTSIENILKLITLIGPLIDFLEILFGKIFPGQKTGDQKKAMAILVARSFIEPGVTDEELSDLIDGYVDQKNCSGEYKHTGSKNDLGIGMP